VAAGPLLPPPPPPQVRQHRDRRRLQPRVPLVQPPSSAAGVFDRGEDLDARGLARQVGRVTERAPGGRTRPTACTCRDDDCHRQRRCTRRSRRQSREGSRRPIRRRPTTARWRVPSDRALQFPAGLRSGFWARPCGAIRDRSPLPTTELLLGRRSLKGTAGHSSCATAEAPSWAMPQRGDPAQAGAPCRSG